jgi:hypothetical protein
MAEFTIGSAVEFTSTTPTGGTEAIVGSILAYGSGRVYVDFPSTSYGPMTLWVKLEDLRPAVECKCRHTNGEVWIGGESGGNFYPCPRCYPSLFTSAAVQSITRIDRALGSGYYTGDMAYGMGRRREELDTWLERLAAGQL